MGQSEELTKDQRQCVKRVDNMLSNRGLTTYSTLEQNCFVALTTAHESVEMGKQLYAIVNKSDGKLAAIKELIKDEPCGCVAPNVCSSCDLGRLRQAVKVIVEL